MNLKPPPSQHQRNDDDEYDFELTIRFSASLPDLHLSIPGSLNANTATLKQLIRSRIPDEYATRRIRLIYAGKALVDEVPLNSSLKRNVSRPPSRISTPGPYEESNGGAGGRENTTAAGKGKLLSRDLPLSPSPPRIYIHCSIGDLVLSKEDVAAERAAAQQVGGDEKNDATSSQTQSLQEQQQQQTTTTPAPRGFDRLQNAGFTPSEIQSLRLQFLAIQAHTHTPDTMPSPNTLRNMEDRWLDNSTSEGGMLGDGAGTLDGSTDEEAQAGTLDDMIWGTVMGFFWPIGCLMWGIREEGIWSQRRKMAVVIGFVLNIGLGLIRYTG
ncbi:uncharacterized protein A1O9_05533 [Exophiala aquamarina CBS 119918]|uniref:Ubiquitin-like domain-containing protein n=1 Tax=Exophiala aquamarina CBS 119918 TaxID=1182545 RepID=A0A072PQ15_9EURO|nr:uncharacterized protein A1O9_05533 [Exophiala aquamarina CBS 119918]KEF57615.1 hypothetical protein A1O9_05533 [Exophiala aquamarina CBS 119918]